MESPSSAPQFLCSGSNEMKPAPKNVLEFLFSLLSCCEVSHGTLASSQPWSLRFGSSRRRERHLCRAEGGRTMRYHLWHYNICTNANGARGFGSREACITESKAKGEPLDRNWEKLRWLKAGPPQSSLTRRRRDNCNNSLTSYASITRANSGWQCSSAKYASTWCEFSDALAFATTSNHSCKCACTR